MVYAAIEDVFFIPCSSIAASLLTFLNMKRQQSESQLAVPFRTNNQSFITDVRTVCQEFQPEIVVVPTNGMTNGEEHNGIGLTANHLKHHFVASPSRLVADGPFSIL